MWKHVRRVIAVFGPAAFVVGYLLTHDIPQTLQQADKSAAQIGTALGVSTPPNHLATYVWHHPFWAIATLALLLALGALLSWGIELLIAGKKTGPEIEAAPATKAEAPPPTVERLGLEGYFFKDFKEGPKGIVANIVADQTIKVAGVEVAIKYIIVLLYEAHAKLLAVYVPNCDLTVQIALFIAENIDSYVEIDEAHDLRAGGPGVEHVSGRDLTFTRKVYIYHLAPVSLADRGKIDAAYRENGLTLQMRGDDYALFTHDSEVANASRHK